MEQRCPHMYSRRNLVTFNLHPADKRMERSPQSLFPLCSVPEPSVYGRYADIHIRVNAVSVPVRQFSLL